MNTSQKDVIKELRELVKSYQKEKNISMVIRIKSIIAYLTGTTAKKISEYLDVSSRTITPWIKAYKKSGLEALKPKPIPGRTPKLNEEAL